MLLLSSTFAAAVTEVFAKLETAGRNFLQSSGIGRVDWQATANNAYQFVADPWVRAAALIVIVYMTIRVIASVYSGDQQNSEMGPVGIRSHTVKRLDRQTIVLPRQLLAMNMDGVTADMKLFYAYVDARGKRCKELVHTHRDIRLSISPVKLARVSSAVYGQEIPDVATRDVCFPSVDLDQMPDAVAVTPARAPEYAVLHKIVENWREDDDALLISVHADELEEIRDKREQFIVDGASRVARARKGNAISRWLKRGIAQQRPNVVGSYYVKFEFSHEPLFVLTRHPDRDLKMTAWLTVLTSMFALVMDVWPKPQTPPVEMPRAIAATMHEAVAPTHATRVPARVP